MSTEKIIKSKSGWLFLLITIVLFAVAALFTLNFVLSAIAADRNPRLDPSFPSIIGALVFFFAGLFVSSGLFSLQPGQAKVCVLFGKYIGTVKDEGLRWANPYYAKTLSTNVGDLSSLASGTGVPTVNVHTSIISTRARTLNGDVLKVNDRMGNPIEIAEVVVWRVSDTAKALFDVDDYDSYVTMQAETALRHVASIYSYDHMEDESESNTAITLRSNIEEVSEALQSELSRNLSVAGITVDDARLTHLSYAPEIAQAMLRRQQAEAIIAARKKIVEGAVSMVDMALTQLSENGVVEFDEDRKAVMASNLMVVLCGE
ncbi:MAG: SPFH domain-containing protein, partial [Atopobium sp.]|nr:SPFH domain-containing protein [Atopobium sp.]